jgi:hypothetical protein
VAEASLADGTPAVLKLLIPQDGAAGRHEITMLRLAGGRGCAGLLRDDAARGALLLERLGPSLWELGTCAGRATAEVTFRDRLARHPGPLRAEFVTFKRGRVGPVAVSDRCLRILPAADERDQ